MARAHSVPAPAWPMPRRSTGAPTGHRRLRRLGLIALVALVVLVSISGLMFWRLNETVSNFPGPHFNQGKNAVWLEHTWVGDIHSNADFDALAATLAREQIRYVYAHVGPMASDGSIPDSLAPESATLTRQLHARMPNLKVLAWIGQLEAASGEPASSTVNLANPHVRAGIEYTAARFVRADGFDGIHYDIEPITNNNSHFLDLLTETRAALPAGAMLSISAQKWAPNAHIADWAYGLGKADAWWTSYYYSKVAEYVDQLVVLAYNTAMPTAGLYTLAVKQETTNIIAAARSAGHTPEVLIGVPTYIGNNFWFRDSAENMETALNGVIAGLNSDQNTTPFVGVAIYRLATTNQSSWGTYERIWLGK
ncbi:MAG TPA: glycosyl hydrolase family 18 protein [Ktedonobacterales bacterium]|nr:glycosyl hydrolase family 18 protein [Ktedonobacterales bacterium]